MVGCAMSSRSGSRIAVIMRHVAPTRMTLCGLVATTRRACRRGRLRYCGAFLVIKTSHDASVWCGLA